VYWEVDVKDDEVRACPRSKGRLLACEADFFNLLCRFAGNFANSFSRCSCFSASNSDCQICSRRRGDAWSGDRGDGAESCCMEDAGDAKAGDRWHWDVGDSGAEEGWGATYECLRSGVCSLERSSWWTAVLKRRQKLGSWTIVGGLCAVCLVSRGKVRRECGERVVYVCGPGGYGAMWWIARDGGFVSFRFVCVACIQALRNLRTRAPRLRVVVVDLS
jgi:hypothetical protein